MFGWFDSKHWIWAWVEVELVSPVVLYPDHQGRLSWFAQVRGRPSSPACGSWQGTELGLSHSCYRGGSSVPIPSGPALNTALAKMGPTHLSAKAQQGWGWLPHPHTLGRHGLHCAYVTRTSSSALPRQGEGRLSQVLQPIEG